MNKFTITTIRHLLEADNIGREAERAWKQNPNPETFIQYAREIGRGRIQGMIELSELPIEIVTSKAVREFMAEFPLKDLSHHGASLKNIGHGARTLLSNHSALLSDQGLLALPREGSRLPSLHIHVIAYKPSSSNERFIIVAQGALNQMGPDMLQRANPVFYIGTWGWNFWTSTSSSQTGSEYYSAIGAGAVMSSFEFGKKALIVYRDKKSNFANNILSHHIRAGNG